MMGLGEGVSISAREIEENDLIGSHRYQMPRRVVRVREIGGQYLVEYRDGASERFTAIQRVQRFGKVSDRPAGEVEAGARVWSGRFESWLEVESVRVMDETAGQWLRFRYGPEQWSSRLASSSVRVLS